MGVCSNYHKHEKITKIGTKLKAQPRKKNHKKCKPKSNPKLKTQRRKAKTQYML
jgi:hypothetical protein